MTKYDYRCKDCQTVTESEHSMSESPEIECSECGSKDTHKIISGGSGFILKANKGGLRTSPGKTNWDWGSRRPDPRQGHKITAEQRRDIERKAVEKYEKKIENEMNKKPTVNEAVVNIMKHDAKKIQN